MIISEKPTYIVLFEAGSCGSFIYNLLIDYHIYPISGKLGCEIHPILGHAHNIDYPSNIMRTFVEGSIYPTDPKLLNEYYSHARDRINKLFPEQQYPEYWLMPLPSEWDFQIQKLHYHYLPLEQPNHIELIQRHLNRFTKIKLILIKFEDDDKLEIAKNSSWKQGITNGNANSYKELLTKKKFLLSNRPFGRLPEETWLLFDNIQVDKIEIWYKDILRRPKKILNMLENLTGYKTPPDILSLYKKYIKLNSKLQKVLF